jgi:hypothetical protein
MLRQLPKGWLLPAAPGLRRSAMSFFQRWIQPTFLVSTFAVVFGVLPMQADDWQPITTEELKMMNEPQAPGAPAIYLYRQVDRDDDGSHEYNYVRIKVLTEEGRKYADVELPFFKNRGTIRSIQARVIQPDGRIVNFDGKVYEKTIVKGGGLKFLAKTFTLPNVQVGTIVEYKYLYDLAAGYVFDSRWIVSEELFTKRAKFSLKPSSQFVLRWSWPAGLPPGTDPPRKEGNLIRLETQNVPAFQTEDFMPPPNELKFRVDFVYSEKDLGGDAKKFWQAQGKELYGYLEAFLGKRKAMEEALSQIVSSNDPPEAKLTKIYARAQQFRNTSFESVKTEQEQKRENLKEENNVEDVWKHGYGDGAQINWLFLALARAAGFEAYPVLASARNEYFFNPELMNRSQLNANLVLVRLNGKDLYFDPGTALAPYGLLPWPETGVQGLRVDKDGGSWVRTTLPEPSESRIERKATLKLSETGDLEGKLTVTFVGLEALWRRLDQRNEDDAARKKFLEDQVQEYVPAKIEVNLKNKPDWSSSSPALVAEYDLKVPGWASPAGQRQLIPIGLFSETEKHLFEHVNRVHPISFDFPFQKLDDVTIELPRSWQVNSLPPEQNKDAHVCAYLVSAEKTNGMLHLRRQLTVDLVLLDAKYYRALRDFFEIVRSSDEQQIVASHGADSAQN